MPINDIFHKQVALLIRSLPYIAEEKDFALKGGTAINLFIRNMPRLSVDIDLTYIPVKPRAESLESIDSAMKRIADSLRSASPGAQVIESSLHQEGAVNKLFVRTNDVQIKIETTPVLRGCVHEPSVQHVSPSVEDEFGYAEIKVVSFSDLYGGKIVAALDRQHPRDLFDIRDLLANEGIDDSLRRAFIVYLLSHDRPMSEVLSARLKDIEAEFEYGFTGMTEQEVLLDELLQVRGQLVGEIVGNMPDEHRHFLVSFERGEPDWTLLGLDGVADLPAVRWRQQNLDSLSKEARNSLVVGLVEVLDA
jgi:predicted nucleotidyltransferase component of viral defense system